MMITSDRTIRWIESLAEQELLIRSGKRASIDITSTKEEVLSAETASFAQDLVQHFEYLVRLFNSRVEKESLQIKLVKGGSDGMGFALLRNRLKLLLAVGQTGRLQVQCMKMMDEGMGSAPRASVMFSGVIESKFGTFHDVDWYFLGARVNAEQVALHYLTEFIQVSRSPSGTA